MMEIERKILDIDKEEVVARIKKLKPAPKKLVDGLVRVKYFDFPDGRIRKAKDLLRLREFVQKGKPLYVEMVYKTFKCVKNNCKYFDELEFKFTKKGSFEELSDFMKSLGLVQSLFYEKKRTLYSWEKTHFEIDEHPRIPAFLEVEAPSPAAVEKAIRALGLDKNEQTAEAIAELMRRKYPKIPLNGLIFK